jgi:nitrate/TMAO reductase-like tetraheme cytochrome c subunit
LHNPYSYAGGLIAALALLIFFFLIILDALSPSARAPYASLIMFMVVPAIMMFGLALVPLGWIMARRRLRRTGKEWIEKFPVIDFNEPYQRVVVGLVVVAGIFLLFLSAFGSYKAYESTESVGFCGTVCHTPMEPEYTAYSNSAHARVRCVDCHVGPGAEWYVRSKLSGLYQLYAVALNKYPRPIPVPITSLRPAQETCEQCHWPEKFFEGQQIRQVHFLPDEENTRWEIDLLIKTGGGSPNGSRRGGIHWHMNNEHRIDYIATDAQHLQIPWVRSTDRQTGRAIEFMSTQAELTEQQRGASIVRTMDCMDCHNRPTHVYRAPAQLINTALASGTIDASLPEIKATGVQLLTGEYDNTEAALLAISDGLQNFYAEQHPEVAKSKRDAITKAIAELQRMYRLNFFPHMKVRWDTYPDNIGHLMFPGCFRCHDGMHQSKDGAVISKDCRLCHNIMAQGKPGAIAHATTRDGLDFEHPIDIGTAWQDGPCNACHTGATP